jgi:S-layer family protein
MRSRTLAQSSLALGCALFAVVAGGAVARVQGQCGPFTDVSPVFCPYVLEMYYLGITAGTSPTTYSPDNPLTRGQAAVFVSKGLNQAMARSSRRAALGQWWTPQNGQVLGLTPVGGTPVSVQSDGQDLWVLNLFNAVSRVRASDGRVLETWSDTLGVQAQTGIVVAMGRVFTTGFGYLYMIDPSQPAGPATVVADTNRGVSTSLTFDGGRFWITDSTGFISIVTPGASTPWAVQTFDVGPSGPAQAIFDGSTVWAVDRPGVALLKMNADGSIADHIPVGGTPGGPVFDGSNIWVPVVSSPDSVAVIRASDGVLLQTLTGNGLFSPLAAAFDGRRVLVTNVDGHSVSLWNAADLAPLGSVSTLPSGEPRGACSDGINFWVAMGANGQLARF